jgi:hypothetical protein
MPIAFALEQFGPHVRVEKLISRSTYLELLNSCKECTVMSKLPGPHPRVEQEGTLSERFQRLAAEWKEQTRFLSNSAQMAMLKPYQRIIGMGPPVVPLILDELRREPDQWFWALGKKDMQCAGRSTRPLLLVVASRSIDGIQCNQAPGSCAMGPGSTGRRPVPA